MLAAVGFIVLYAVEPDTQFLGMALGLALLALAGACGVAGKRVVPDVEAVEPRPRLEDPAVQEDVAAVLDEGMEGVSRKRFFVLLGGGAAGLLGAALLTPAISCGPEANRVLSRSPWRRGVRLVNESDEPVSAAGIVVGELVMAFPEGAD